MKLQYLPSLAATPSPLHYLHIYMVRNLGFTRHLNLFPTTQIKPQTVQHKKIIANRNRGNYASIRQLVPNKSIAVETGVEKQIPRKRIRGEKGWGQTFLQ
jgi:hypothetical protein